MKRQRTAIVTVATILVALLALTGTTDAGPRAMPMLQSGAPTVVGYQGRVTLDGTPYEGIGLFKFAIVNNAGDFTYWSNDGTSQDGGEPEAPVELEVSNGLFNVLLGDVTLDHMLPLEAGHFGEGTVRYLRVWFSEGGSFEQLVPDRRFAAVPYTLQAEMARDAAMLSGQPGSAYAPSSHTHAPVDIAPQGAGSWLDADLLDGKQSSAFQTRVIGTCSPGSTVRAINADGSVVCEAHEARPVFSTTNVDSVGDGGGGASVTIGVDGLGLISYCDETLIDLKVAHCEDIACTTATTTIIDSNSHPNDTSISIGADGLGLIAYSSGYPSQDLMVAHCNNVPCTSATIAALDTTANLPAAAYVSMAIGADGLGLISYHDSIPNHHLKVAHCNDIACTSATLTALDGATADVGWYNSITIGADGLGLISYGDSTNGNLKVAHCEDVACTSATISVLDSATGVGGHNSITTGVDGLGLVSYRDGANLALKVAHCSNSTCNSATLTTLDSGGDPGGGMGMDTSITVGADGFGLISYLEGADEWDLRVAHCNNIACTSATTTVVEGPSEEVVDTAITVGNDGLGLISYTENGYDVLKVVHCSNRFCIPHVRPR